MAELREEHRLLVCEKTVYIRERKKQEAGENCVMRSCKYYTFLEISLEEPPVEKIVFEHPVALLYGFTVYMYTNIHNSVFQGNFAYYWQSHRLAHVFMQIHDMFLPHKTILRYNCYTVLKYYVAHVAHTSVSLLIKRKRKDVFC
jgi:hypothetical protein